MRRRIWYFSIVVLAMMLLLTGLRMWVAHRIEISLARHVICLTPHDRANIVAGHFSMEKRDFLVVKNAQFGNDAPSGPTPGWHWKGVLLDLGYGLLWSERGRAAEFARIKRHMHDCPGPRL